MTRALVALVLTALTSVSATGTTTRATNFLDARVVSVADGDTITVLDANKVQYKIRLGGIDSPEKNQPFGQRSKQSLSAAVMSKDVRVEWSTQDHYGRLVGKVWATPPELHCDSRTTVCPKSLDVNLAQLKVGLAWYYKDFEKGQSRSDRQHYAVAEQEARARQAGLWSEPDPTPPWDWRHENLGGATKKATSSGICHAPGTASYSSVKKATKYPTLEACLASGGRLPKQPGH